MHPLIGEEAAVLSENGSRVLVMTVGTGTKNELEESLFAPMRKSIATDAWTQVVLLPSRVTEKVAEKFAETVRKGIPDVAVRPLPEGDEDDADRAYAHFDSVLDEALRKTPAEAVMVDFTRGTKAMSAALVLAAARHEIPYLRYITAQEGGRDKHGRVKADFEDIREIRTTVGAGHRRLDLARGLMRSGSFLGAEAVLPDMDHPSAALYPDDLIETATAVRTATRFYAAWDRLDYAEASGVDVGEPPDGHWKELWPTSAAREWVVALAEGKELRRLIVDLLANGERRLRQGHHEDALVRAYRVLELIGQARLFDHGLDSGSLDPDHAAVKAAVEKITKKKQDPLGSGRDGRLQAGRFQVARILEALEDPLAKTSSPIRRQIALETDAPQQEPVDPWFRGRRARRPRRVALSVRRTRGAGERGRRRECRRRLAFGRANARIRRQLTPKPAAPWKGAELRMPPIRS